MQTCVKKTNIKWYGVLYKQTQVYILHIAGLSSYLSELNLMHVEANASYLDP